MARNKNVVRPVVKQISLDEATVGEVELLLFSSIENKVPYGAWSRLVTELLQQMLRRKQANNELRQDLRVIYGDAQAQVARLKVELTKHGYSFE